MCVHSYSHTNNQILLLNNAINNEILRITFTEIELELAYPVNVFINKIYITNSLVPVSWRILLER